jgi:hypothetical protein
MSTFFCRIASFLFVLLVILSVGCKKEAALGPPITVSLKIDSGSPTTDKELSISTHEKQTVIDAMNAAKSQGLSYKIEGEGAGAMVVEINGVSAEAPTNGGKNWIFYINQKKANRSAGVYPLAYKDAILWKFEAFDPNQSND